ncbi:YeaC family protein [Kistimonas scapharcae]|uniref:YeaC family protein n=1 Tax=Kistimonas scapharcae TaxID=1036133 RepID=A0ABP8UWM9_9GAMM
MEFDQLIKTMTSETVANLRRAVELGKWPDGRKLTPEQRESSLQAVIAWERHHLPECERTGYMAQACRSHKNETSSEESKDNETILRFRDA